MMMSLQMQLMLGTCATIALLCLFFQTIMPSVKWAFRGGVWAAVFAFVNFWLTGGQADMGATLFVAAIGFVIGATGIIGHLIKLLWKFIKWIWKTVTSVVRVALVVAIILVIVFIKVRYF